MKRISERLVEAKAGLVMSSALIYFIFFIYHVIFSKSLFLLNYYVLPRAKLAVVESDMYKVIQNVICFISSVEEEKR